MASFSKEKINAVDFTSPELQDLVYQYFKTTESQARLRSFLQNNSQENSADRSPDDQWTPSELGATETTVSESYASKGPIVQVLKRMSENLEEGSKPIRQLAVNCRNRRKIATKQVKIVVHDHIQRMRLHISEFLYVSIWHTSMPQKLNWAASSIKEIENGHPKKGSLISASFGERVNADWKFHSIIEDVNSPFLVKALR